MEHWHHHPIELRAIGLEDMQRAWDIGAQAFSRGERREYSADRFNTDFDAYGVYDEDGLQAQVGVHRYKVFMGNGPVVEMAGVGGVSCLPAKRGRGYIGRCVVYSLEQMQDRGQSISMLFPFSQAFYRKYGWEVGGPRRRYEVPASILHVVKETNIVRAAGAEDAAAIQACYEAFATRYRGMICRNEHEWKAILDHGSSHYTYTYLYAPKNVVEGYLTYSKGSYEDTYIREFIALNSTAQRALLGLLHRVDMQVEKFRWHAPSDDALWWNTGHNDVTTTIEPICMVRVVDVQAALQLWRTPSALRAGVCVEVVDPHAPWNQGVWEVECEGGSVTVKRGYEIPQLTLDIQALSQAFCGGESLAAIRAARGIEVRDEAGFNALQQMLAGPPMWMNDGF